MARTLGRDGTTDRQVVVRATMPTSLTAEELRDRLLGLFRDLGVPKVTVHVQSLMPETWEKEEGA